VAALPATLTSLSLSSVLYDDGVVEEVAAYCTRRYPWRVAHKISYWSSSNDPSYTPTRAFLTAIDERTHGGVEAANLLSDMPDAARDAIAWRAVLWAEPYPSNRDQMQALYDEQQRHRRWVLATRLLATPEPGGVVLSWTRPSAEMGFERVRLLRRTDGYAAGPDDPSAAVVYEGTATSTTDHTPGYYTLYALPSGYTLAQAAVTPLAFTASADRTRGRTREGFPSRWRPGARAGILKEHHAEEAHPGAGARGASRPDRRPRPRRARRGGQGLVSRGPWRDHHQ
jgi:hypothetical protein